MVFLLNDPLEAHVNTSGPVFIVMSGLHNDPLEAQINTSGSLVIIKDISGPLNEFLEVQVNTSGTLAFNIDAFRLLLKSWDGIQQKF